MANDPRNPTDEELEELLEQEGLSGEGLNLSDEIVRKWDPERLLKLASGRGGRGERLDETTRRRYERKLGTDLSDVRVYTGEFAEEVAKSHRADAVTIGTTGMIMMPDKSTETADGRALLAHELTHVAQSQRGVHRRATFGEAAPLATEEHEAEAAEAEAAERAGEEGEEESEDERNAKLFELVRSRVLDMFAEDHRLWLIRNGDEVWRP